MAQSNTVIDKYLPSQGGVVGLWNQGSTAMGNNMKSVSTAISNLAGVTGNVGDWGNALIYGGVIIIGGVLLLIAFSFTSGKQDISKVISAVR